MTKPYLDYDQQIEKLTKEKGLIINDKAYAKEMLVNIGYFSLIGGYKNLFINPMTRRYETPTTIEDIVALYQFDEELRQLTFSYIVKVEQKIRQLVSASFCSFHGEQQAEYLSRSNYTMAQKREEDVTNLIKILHYNANINTDKSYLIHQRKTYGNVPLWVTTKVLTFGQLSKFYVLLPSKIQSKISKEYRYVSEKNLARYLNALTLFRNVCAHNERLFSFKMIKQDFPDTLLHKKLSLPQKGTQYLLGKKDYFGVVIALRYLLPPQDFLEFKRKLKKTITSFGCKSERLSESELYRCMGMPDNWEKITRYKL